MPNEQLVTYIRGEFANGVDREVVIRSLLASGWKTEDINTAMTSISHVPSASASHIPKPVAAPVESSYPVSHTSSQSNSIKTAIQDFASALFIVCVVILTAISILGVWDVFSGDVIMKSFETLGLLAFVSIIVIAASSHTGDQSTAIEPQLPNPIYHSIRNITMTVLIISSSFLALLGVLAIWDVITDTSTVSKSLSSLGILAFSSFIIVMVCTAREQTSKKKVTI